MKILSAEQIREADKFTIENEPIPSIDLMERAADTIYWELMGPLAFTNQAVKIFCGIGNNGGDGIVIARKLFNSGCDVNVFVLASDKRSEDCQANLEAFKEIAADRLFIISNEKDLPEIDKDDVIIDAIFGTGLNRPADGIAAKMIDHINDSGAEIYSVDIPSGLYTDQANDEEDSIIKAKKTYTFQFPKLSFLLCENYIYTGNWSVLDIGLSEEFINSVATNNFYIQKIDAKKILKPRSKISHKGMYGHALIWAGSYGKMGAAVLASNACLRTGAGLTTTYIPGCGYEIIQTTLPEVMVLVDDNKKMLTNVPDTFNYATLGIGPGIGTSIGTKDALAKLLKHFKKPVVLDADALNILSQDQDLLERIPENSILTPHPKEFSRLAGECKNDWERIEKATLFATDHNCIIVLKSAMTSIHTPDGKVYFNSTGNPGMAKGGSGDALTGILTALLAQGYEPADAAILGVYLHGLAGDLAKEKHGVYSMAAGDLIGEIGAAYEEISDCGFSIAD